MSNATAGTRCLGCGTVEDADTDEITVGEESVSIPTCSQCGGSRLVADSTRRIAGVQHGGEW